MRSKFLPLIVCIFMVACAEEDIKETGITRARAIAIAEAACKEYPGRFSYMDRAEWDRDGRFWVVELADRSGDHGRAYKINRSGKIIDTHDVSRDRDDSHERLWYY